MCILDAVGTEHFSLLDKRGLTEGWLGSPGNLLSIAMFPWQQSPLLLLLNLAAQCVRALPSPPFPLILVPHTLSSPPPLFVLLIPSLLPHALSLFSPVS